jgi:pimeloyl-ACP methyl ester carboxylesterase
VLRTVTTPSGVVGIDESGDGPVVVLLHGAGSSYRTWHRVAPPLAVSHRVLAVDLPGFGTSAAPPNGYDPRLVADRVAESLHQLGAARYDLVGHSLGGAVATHLAARHPHRVGRLVLIAPLGLRPVSPLTAQAAAAAFAMVLRLRRLLVARHAANPAARRVALRRVVFDPVALSAIDARLMINASADATRTAAAVRAVLSEDLAGVLACVAAPVTLIWGRRDRILNPAAISVAQHAQPTLRVIHVERCGHLPMLEAPLLVVRTLTGAGNDTDASPAAPGSDAG